MDGGASGATVKIRPPHFRRYSSTLLLPLAVWNEVLSQVT